jgi:hypothetical protein
VATARDIGKLECGSDGQQNSCIATGGSELADSTVVKRPTWIACVMILTGYWSAAAQSWSAAAFSSPRERLEVPITSATPPQTDRARDLPVGTPWLEDPSTHDFQALTDFIDQLPIERLQNLLKTNQTLRLVEIATGLALIGIECGSGMTRPLVSGAAVQALRLSGGVFEPRSNRFYVTLSIRNGGAAIFVRRSM